MKPKVTISTCVGYERGTGELVWPVNLQPSSRSLLLLRTKVIYRLPIYRLDVLQISNSNYIFDVVNI
jgi:hypothetical protein